MAIIFAGGEAEDFTMFGAAQASTSWGTMRAAYARMSMQVPSHGTFATNYVQAAFPASSLIGFTARVYNELIDPDAFVLWLSSGGSPRLRLKTTTNKALLVESWNGSTAVTLGSASTLTLASGQIHRFDVLVNYASGGYVRVYVNGALFIDFSGDPRVGGSTTLDALNLGSTYPYVGVQTYWSEVIVTDGEDPRPLSLKTLAPESTGDTSQWVGGFAEIDEIIASDIDVATSATAGQVLNMECSGMPSGASGLSVRAVKVVASALRGASGPSKLQLGVKSGGTEGWSADKALDTGYGVVSNTWTTNPATGSAFTNAELESLKLAIKSIA